MSNCPLCLNRIDPELKDSADLHKKGLVHILCFENLIKGEKGMNDDFTKPTQEKLAEAAKPLIKYLAENYHPHITCIVDATHAEVLESQMMIRTEEFLRD